MTYLISCFSSVTCQFPEILCKADKICLEPDFVCNAVADCTDFSDEENCGIIYTLFEDFVSLLYSISRISAQEIFYKVNN